MTAVILKFHPDETVQTSVSLKDIRAAEAEYDVDRLIVLGTNIIDRCASIASRDRDRQESLAHDFGLFIHKLMQNKVLTASDHRELYLNLTFTLDHHFAAINQRFHAGLNIIGGKLVDYEDTAYPEQATRSNGATCPVYGHRIGPKTLES